MKILVVGSGGREHALAWKLKQSPDAERIFCAPGNAGTAEIGENVAISAGDLRALVRFAKENRVDLTVVGQLPRPLADRLPADGQPLVERVVLARDPEPPQRGAGVDAGGPGAPGFVQVGEHDGGEWG
jgi:hypothetical protein